MNMQTLQTKLQQVGLSREMPMVVSVFWRGTLLGTVLFLSLSDDPVRNLKFNFISYIVATVWCYYDGAFTRGRWSRAWLEGLPVHFAGVGFGNLLALVFGSPLTPN